MTDARDEAVEWHVAMPTMDEERWMAFTAWLEADPVHVAAYDSVALADRGLADFGAVAAKNEHVRPVSTFIPAPVMKPSARFSGRRTWVGAACAASLAALLVVGTMQVGKPDGRYTVTTQAGTPRTIAMGDGSSVVLNGATRVAFDRDNPRTARLDEGEALFSVRHDAERPFAVTVGRFRVEDVGTVFNVVRDKGRLSVSVAEGRVLFDPEGAKLMLAAGDMVTVDEANAVLVRGKATNVGGWQHGDLEFADVPMVDVASAIHRLTGAQIMVSDPLSRVPFTGNVRLSGRAGTDARHLANLVGAQVHRDGEKWVLSSSSRDLR